MVVKNCAISNNVKYFLISTDYDLNSSVHVYSMLDGQFLITLCGHTAEITAAVFSPEDRLLLTASKDTTAIIWN